MSGFIPIDDWFKAHEESQEPHTKAGIVEELYQGVTSGKRCRSSSCDRPVRGDREYCDRCHAKQLRDKRLAAIETTKEALI